MSEYSSDSENWQIDGLCGKTDPEVFFPRRGTTNRDAKLICSGCIVRSECLEYALEHHERFGVWGGLSEQERRKLARLQYKRAEKAGRQ